MKLATTFLWWLLICRKQRKAPREAGRGLLDIFCEIILVQILIEILHVIFFVLLKVLPYNRYKVICFRNIFFTFLNITKLFIASGNALKKTPMECLHTFPKILFCRIIIVVCQKECRKHMKSFLIAFQSLGNIIIWGVIAELNIGMLIHEKPSVSFLHTSLI